RGVPFVTGGRDHLTHRLLPRAGSARRVALFLAAGQSFLVGLTIAASELGQRFLIATGLAAILAGVAGIAVLESAAWRPSCDFERARDRELLAGRAADLEVATSPKTAPASRLKSAQPGERSGRPARDLV